MNKRKAISEFVDIPDRGLVWLCVVSVAFAAGVFAGALAAPGGAEGGAQFIEAYLEGLSAGGVPGLLPLLFELSAFHIAVFLCGFSMLGVVLAPGLSFVRGFSIAYSLAMFVRLYAFSGAVAAYMLFGVCTIVSVPLFFMLAVQSLSASVELMGGAFGRGGPLRPGAYGRVYFIRFLIAMLILSLLALAQRCIIASGVIDLPAYIQTR